MKSVKHILVIVLFCFKNEKTNTIVSNI